MTPEQLRDRRPARPFDSVRSAAVRVLCARGEREAPAYALAWLPPGHGHSRRLAFSALLELRTTSVARAAARASSAWGFPRGFGCNSKAPATRIEAAGALRCHDLEQVVRTLGDSPDGPTRGLAFEQREELARGAIPALIGRDHPGGLAHPCVRSGVSSTAASSSTRCSPVLSAGTRRPASFGTASTMPPTDVPIRGRPSAGIPAWKCRVLPRAEKAAEMEGADELHEAGKFTRLVDEPDRTQGRMRGKLGGVMTDDDDLDRMPHRLQLRRDVQQHRSAFSFPVDPDEAEPERNQAAVPGRRGRHGGLSMFAPGRMTRTF